MTSFKCRFLVFLLLTLNKQTITVTACRDWQVTDRKVTCNFRQRRMLLMNQENCNHTQN